MNKQIPGAYKRAHIVTQSHKSSPQAQLLHHAEKFFFIEHAISITVRIFKHRLKLIISQRLISLPGNALQVLEGDTTCVVIIEEPKGFQHVILGVLVQDLVSHHLQELVKSNLTAAIVIHLSNHFLNLPWLRLTPKRLHCDGQLLDVNVATSISVKEVKGLLDLLLLLLIELRLFLAAAFAHGHKKNLGGGTQAQTVLLYK